MGVGQAVLTSAEPPPSTWPATSSNLPHAMTRQHRIAFVLLCLGAALAPLAAHAQAVISGTVTDTDGEPLTGAQVVLQGSTLGAVADLDGVYSFTVPASTANGQTHTLLARFVGYETARRPVQLAPGEQVQDFTLAVDLLNLDEVVVTGVGQETSTRQLGIDVSSVSGDKLTTAPAVTLDAALAGKIAGAQITQQSGQPGTSAQILLRGINTLGNGTPMILIDGIQINTDANYAGTEKSDLTPLNSNDRLADIDFNDVERVEVVKGAAAATIYGAQGANGVIQIFTKTGQVGRPQLRLSTTVSSNEALGRLPKAGFHFYETDASGSIVGLSRDPESGQWTVPNLPGVSASTLNDKPYAEPTFDHYDLVLRDAVTQQYSAQLSGGTARVRYLLSANWLDQGGVIDHTYNRRNAYRFNLETDLTDKLRLGVRTNLALVENRGTENGNNVTSPFQVVVFELPFINPAQRDADGDIVATTQKDDNSTNPLFEFENREKLIENIRTIGSISLNYRPVRFLELDYKFGADRYDFEFDEFQRNFSANPIATLTPQTGFVQRVSDRGTTLNSLFTSTWRFALRPSLSSSTLAAFDWRREDYQQTDAFGQDLPPFGSRSTLRAAATPTVDETLETFLTYGFVVNQKFDFDERAGLSFGGRMDWSSAFGQGQDATFFPRADVYLRVSDFRFWQPIRPAIADLKLRAAYGEAGTQPGAFTRIRTLAQDVIGNTGILLSPETLQNPLLVVQKSREFEVGSDATFRLGETILSQLELNYTFWTRESEDVIEELDVAPSTGAATLKANGIDLSSQGHDVALSSLVFYNERFSWLSTLTFGRAATTVTNIDNGADLVIDVSTSTPYLFREGERVGVHFGFKALRSFDELVDPEDPTSGFVIDQDAVAAGRYAMIDGKVVDTETRQVVFRQFQEALGDPNPNFTLGFRNEFNVRRRLGLTVQVDWVQGPSIYNKTKQWMYRDFIHGDFDEPVLIDNPAVEGDETAQPWVAYYQSLYKTNDKNEFFVEDGSYVRLREVALSYDIAHLLPGRVAESFRLSLSGRNLLTWTGYSGVDPEVNHFGNDVRVRGTDELTYPNFRTISFGTSITF